MHSFIASLRLTIVSLVICVAGYAAVILGFAKIFAAEASTGSLLSVDGKIVGSRLIAQRFTAQGYFWPRPSAAGKDGYDAANGAGSNKSPTSTDLTDRARQIVGQYGATTERPLPAELAAASGSGLDPHLTEHAALYQAARVAKARSLGVPEVESLIKQRAFVPSGAFTPERLVNVLELNIALDAIAKPHEANPTNR